MRCSKLPDPASASIARPGRGAALRAGLALAAALLVVAPGCSGTGGWFLSSWSDGGALCRPSSSFDAFDFEESDCQRAFTGHGFAIVTSWSPGQHVLQVDAGGKAATTVPVVGGDSPKGTLSLLVRCDVGAKLLVSIDEGLLTVAADASWTSQTLPLGGLLTVCGPSSNRSLGFEVVGVGACQLDELEYNVSTESCCGGPCLEDQLPTCGP
jgi:hypothetical protein